MLASFMAKRLPRACPGLHHRGNVACRGFARQS